jgi:hypothetical protein
MRHIFAALCFLVLLAGCGGPDRGTAIETERFVSAVVELRRAAAQTWGDTAAFAARKTEILRTQGVTEEDLRQYVEVHGENVQYMADVWNSINTELSDRGLDLVQ